MRVRYFGKKVVRDEFGHVKARYNPEVLVTFTEKEKDLAFKLLDATGYAYDSFGREGNDGADIYEADVYVRDREDADDFIYAWKEAKRTIKEVKK